MNLGKNIRSVIRDEPNYHLCVEKAAVNRIIFKVIDLHDSIYDIIGDLVFWPVKDNYKQEEPNELR